MDIDTAIRLHRFVRALNLEEDKKMCTLCGYNVVDGVHNISCELYMPVNIKKVDDNE